MSKLSLRPAALVALTALVFAFVGCKDGGYSAVKGKVTHKGQPLAGATVVFKPETKDAPAATAVTKDDGTFEIQTNLPGGKTKPGAAPGNYKVTVSKVGPPSGMSEADFQKKVEAAGSGTYAPNATTLQKVELIPPAFSSPAETKVTATVTASGPNEVNVDVP